VFRGRADSIRQIDRHPMPGDYHRLMGTALGCWPKHVMLRTIPITIETFDDAVGPALRHQAVLNQLELGIVDSIRAEPTRYPQGVRMLALADDATGDVGVAVQTPPHNPLVSMTGETVAHELGRRFVDAHGDPRFVFGPESAAIAFARGAGARHPRAVSRDGVFELREVKPVPAAAGFARMAGPDDALLLQEWMDAFLEEALPAGFPKDPRAGARLAGNGRTWLWCEPGGEPMSVATNHRRVAGWWAFGYVYTPPAHRGHGWATSLVAHASTWALGSGAVGCTLFTDLANPVSNRIYERIGYRRVGTRATIAW
jgi:GNAT superfamily N-acetyltransferase